MRRDHHYLPTRSSVIFDATRRMLRDTAQNVVTFTMSVAEQYLLQVHPDFRQVKFREDLVEGARHNGQILCRYLDGTVKVLPADLEDAWVTALPEPFRSECERDLAGRRGLLAVKQGGQGITGKAAGIVELMQEFGHLVEALAPALADGRIDGADVVHAKRILQESDDLMAAVICVRRQVTELLPGGSVDA